MEAYLRRISFSLIIIAVIYNSGYAMMTVNSTVGSILLLIGIVLIFLSNPQSITTLKINYLNIYFILSILILLASMFVNLNFIYIGANLKYLSILIFSFYFVQTVDYKVFIKYYINIMLFIVFISLIPFYLYNYFNINFLGYLPIVENINGVKYYNGILFFFYDYTQTRNMGLFWEPSIYSSFIIIAMMYEISYNKPSIIKIMLLLIGVISTGSTGGYLLIPFVFTLYLFKNINVLSGILIQSMVALGGFLIYINFSAIFSFLLQLSPLVFGKFSRDGAASVNERVDSPLINIDLFLQNPVFGNGLGKIDELYSKFEIAQTSTPTYYLAAFGVLGIMYSISIFYGCYNQKQLNFNQKTLMFIIFFVIVSKEPHSKFILTHIIIFYLLKPSSSKTIKKKLFKNNTKEININVQR
jgi:hypothetical protein